MGKFNVENLCDNDYAHIDLNTILMFTADQATNYDPESMIRKPLMFSNASALKHKLIKLDQDEAVKLLNDLIQECMDVVQASQYLSNDDKKELLNALVFSPRRDLVYKVYLALSSMALYLVYDYAFLRLVQRDNNIFGVFILIFAFAYHMSILMAGYNQVAQSINLKCTVSSNDFIFWSHHVAEKINNLSSYNYDHKFEFSKKKLSAN